MKPDQSSQSVEDNFFDLFETYQDAIFRFVLFRVKNRALATDITQDVFTRVWQYLAGGQKIDHPQAFLYRTARNAVVDYYKRSKTYSLDDLVTEGFEPEVDTTNDAIFKQDDIASVQKLLEELDEKSKQIIFLRYAEERSLDDIAELFDKTPNALAVQIHRIIEKLRKSYDKYHGE
ncbi:MAG: sigma-70 family RNA polymerase sigma factor [bacterium]